MRVGTATLAPYVSVADLRLHQDAFTEMGSAMGLAAPQQVSDVTYASVGVRYGQRFDSSLGQSSLQGYSAWRRDFIGTELAMTVSFAGVPSQTFATQGQNLSRNVGMVGMHWNTQVNHRWSWFLDTDYLMGGGNLDRIEAHAGISMAF